MFFYDWNTSVDYDLCCVVVITEHAHYITIRVTFRRPLTFVISHPADDLWNTWLPFILFPSFVILWKHQKVIITWHWSYLPMTWSHYLQIYRPYTYAKNINTAFNNLHKLIENLKRNVMIIAFFSMSNIFRLSSWIILITLINNGAFTGVKYHGLYTNYFLLFQEPNGKNVLAHKFAVLKQFMFFMLIFQNMCRYCT